MLPRSIRNAIAWLRSDNLSGATDLNLRTIDIFRRYLDTARKRDKDELLQDLRILCRGLMFAQPAMSSIHNTCVEVLSALATYRDMGDMRTLKGRLEKKLARLATHFEQARMRIARHFEKVLPKHGRVLTISYSSTVTGVLTELKQRGRDFEVIVTESRPMFEGRRTAHELLKAGIPTTLVADAAVGEFSKGCDLAVAGADTVFSDRSTLNKIGTYPLALCCNEARIPLYVLADSSKLSFEPSSAFVPETKNPFELFHTPPKGLLIENIYFDLTPSRLITAIITENGSLGDPAGRKILKRNIK